MLKTDDQAGCWFDEMANERPLLIAELALRGIVSALTYSTYMTNTETHLDNILEEVEEFRFAWMLRAINQDDPFQVIRIAPSWLLHLPITALMLPIRCRRVLESKNVQSFSDLLKYQYEEARHWKNFGKKSAQDLSIGLLNAIKRGAQHFEIAAQLTSAKSDNSPEDISDKTVKSFTDTAGNIPLKEELALAIASLPDGKATVFQGRFMSFPRQTLEEIGSQLRLTRERVRQIEKHCLTLINERYLFPKLISLKIARLIRGRKTPLYLDTIHEQDSWFAGFSHELGKLGTVIKAFSEGSIFEYDDRIIVSRIGEVEFEDLKRKALKLLGETKPMVLRQSEVETILSELAIEAGSPEIGGLLVTALEHRIHFTFPTDASEPLLVGVGLGVKHIVSALLNEAEEPLHYTELTRRCSARLGRELDERLVHNVLIANHAHYYGRGAYGTIRQLPVMVDIQN
jgi:hypothetical protein